ncbi:MAG: ABC transporter ATP-binding protein [Culicoidibacterales bacterium]
MKLMLRYVKKYRIALLFNFISVFAFVIIELGLPTILARIIDEGIGMDDFEVVKYYGLIMLGVIILGLFGVLTLAYFGARISTNVVRDIRDDVFAKTRIFSTSEVNQIGVASLMTRTGNDPFQVMLFLQLTLRVGMITPVMFIASIIMSIKTSPSLSLTLAVAFPLLILAVIWMAIISAPISRAQQKNLDGINRTMRESLTGIRVLRAFVKEKFQQRRFEDINSAYANSSKRLFYLMSLAAPAFGLLFSSVIVAIVWYGATAVSRGELRVGQLTAFVDYIFHALFSFMMFTTLFAMYPKASVSAARIEEVLAITPSIESSPKTVPPTGKKGHITFKNVTFVYSDGSEEPTLRDISFTAKPGQVVAFIGSTGSGKSTLIQLIPRFYDISEGEILIDDIAIKSYDLATLRAKIGFIPQKALLFTGTISENLRFGDINATKEDLATAAKIAQAGEFIEQLPDQYESFIAEGGNNLSGGQKQRLAIARALVRKPEIYIFDDSFSALDYRTDAKLRAALVDYTKESTVLIVAQRIGTIMNADKIIVLDEGRIVAQGTHKELLKSSEIYYDIAQSQLSKEELA